MDLTERTLKLAIYDFLELVGLPLRPMEEYGNEWFLEEFGWEQRARLADAVNDEFMQTVACGRSGDAEILYMHLNTGDGTKHWQVLGGFQGIPA